MEGVATFSVDREGPRRIRGRAADGANASATWAPLAGLGVGAVLLLLCLMGRQVVAHVWLRHSMPSVLYTLVLAAVSCGVCVALLRAHARGVPLVAAPALAMASLPLFGGAAAARLDWAHTMREHADANLPWLGPERCMFLFGIGALLSVALAIGVGVAFRSIDGAERSGGPTTWLAFALAAVAAGCVTEAFARWVLPGPFGLAEASDRALRDWDALLFALPLSRGLFGGVAALLVTVALVRARRGASWRAFGTVAFGSTLLVATCVTAQAVAGGAEQLVGNGAAFQVARATELVPASVSSYPYVGGLDALIGADYVVDDAGRRLARRDLARLARERAAPAAMPEFLREIRWGLMGEAVDVVIRVEPRLDVALDGRMTGEQLGSVIDDLARGGVYGIRIVGPSPLSVPPEHLRTPLLRIGTRRFDATVAGLEGGYRKARATSPRLAHVATELGARVTGIHATTLEVATTQGPLLTWSVAGGRIVPVREAAAEDPLGDMLRLGLDTPTVVSVPVALGSVEDVVRAVSLLALADVTPILCVHDCP